jgi:uncharacterized protein YbcC (UPF0753/DUF2309 family)
MTHSAQEIHPDLNQLEGNSMKQAYLSAVQEACQRIAPLWPLDQSIAVNPWWPMRNKTMTEVAANLDVLGRVHCFMPKAYFKSLWQEQKIQARHLALATDALGMQATTSSLLDYLDIPLPESHWMNVSDIIDDAYAASKKMAWHDEIIYQISQFCGGFFQHPEALAADDRSGNSLYSAWLKTVRLDKGIEILMGERGLIEQFKRLPNEPLLLIQEAQDALLSADTPPAVFADYCHALLLDINGWASWLAYQEWQDNFVQKAPAHVLQILAIRLAWDLVLWRHRQQLDDAGVSRLSFSELKQQFHRQLQNLPQLLAKHRSAFAYLSIWQRASEFAYQLPLQAALSAAGHSEDAGAVTQKLPSMQAVFCIDVRSEPMRRALEAQHPNIQTFGFAGFFGLPIEYSPQGSEYVRPQLPGLLKPAIRAVQSQEKRKAIDSKAVAVRKQFSARHTLEGASSSFGLIEAQGLMKVFHLLKQSLLAEKPKHQINDLDGQGEWQLSQNGQEMSTEQLAQLAAGILNALGLTENFAPVVLLFGHGSCSSNNPYAAALDCGACGGQTGEVNARILAQLLNSVEVRQALESKGILIPAATRFIAGLHNTTTDELICYGLDASQKHSDWFACLQVASAQAQAQRLAAFDLPPGKQDANKVYPNKIYQNRARDWAQTRPEWGLANNAAFIVAPRHQTRMLDLQGRSFLHDYDWRKDKDFSVLELIITAPMVVTNWINLQYYASVTDNLKYGSGNKLLHNVVGGHIGVFEGNSGDLRGGLAIQSVHDGQQWRHQPLRLSVYISAPREEIARIVSQHPHIADLVNNQWLFLFQLDESDSPDQPHTLWQYQHAAWQAVPRLAETIHKDTAA